MIDQDVLKWFLLLSVALTISSIVIFYIQFSLTELLKRFDYRLSLVCREAGFDLDKLERDAMLDDLEALEKEPREKEAFNSEKI